MPVSLRSAKARLLVCLFISIAFNIVFGTWGARLIGAEPAFPQTRAASVRIERFYAPKPKQMPTPPVRWNQLDRGALRSMQRFPDHLQIVVQGARQTNGAPSSAPSILRVDVSPPDVHASTVMHIRVLATPDANGVYLRFAVWELAVPPVGAGAFSASDPDFPGRKFEMFARDYAMPPIPPIFTGRTYNVQIVAVGRTTVASATYVPLTLE